MPTFTMELGEVLGITDNIGLDKYPIFDENYRKTLNSKIIDHYYNQEIGRETISMFRLSMSRRMNEIMPYYNQLYESEKLKINPLLTVDMESTGTNSSKQDAENTSTSSSDVVANSSSYNTEYPQTSILTGEEYASSGNRGESDTVSEAKGGEKSTATGSGENASRTKGIQGNQSAMLNAYRETFLNIDLQIIMELSDCFMGIWNNTDNYAGSPVFHQIERLF